MGTPLKDNSVKPLKDENKLKELYTVLLAQHPRNALLLRFGLNTLLRIGDILEIRYSDVFTDRGNFRDYLRLREEKTQKKKVIMLNNVIRKDLREYCETYNLTGDDPLFMNFHEPDRPISRIQAWRILNKCSQILGIEKFGTHSLRKTAAWRIYDKTKDLSLVQKMLNHCSTKETIRYLGLDQALLDETYQTHTF